MANFAAFLDQQGATEHDVLSKRENPVLKHGPYLLDEPVVQLGAAIGFGYEFDLKTNFRHGDGAVYRLSRG